MESDGGVSSTGSTELGEKLADFAEHEVALSGRWTGHHGGPHRWMGSLQLPVPAFLVALAPSLGETYYTKSKRLEAGSCDVTLSGDRDLADRPRFVLKGERTIDLSAYLRRGGEPTLWRESVFYLDQVVAPATGFFDVPNEFRFRTGRVAEWRSEAGAAPGLRLLVLAAGDVATKRCGIWGIKRRHRGSLPDAWHPVLTRTRWGLAEV